MNGVDAALLAAILVMLVVLAYLAIAETSLNRISRVKAHTIVDAKGTRAAHSLYRLVSRPEMFINPLLIAVTLLQMGQATLTTLLANRLFGSAGVIVGFFVNFIVFFISTEAMPKTYAVMHSESGALRTARITELLVRFPPLRLVSRGLIGLTNVIMPGKGLKEGPFVSEQELLGIVEAAADDEVIEHEERELIESIIEFGDTIAREVMVPRPDMVIIPNEASISAALDLAIEHGHSRLPVFGSEEGDVIGLAYAKDLIRAERDGEGAAAVLGLVRPVRFIPENKPVARLMREMQAGKFHMAIVADEYGEVAGLVTLEDCLEELVGEIVDEYDIEEHDIEQLPDGDLLVDGGTPISELNEVLNIDLPDDDWDTIGGLVFSTLEHVPTEGEELEYDGWHITATAMEGRRIRKVRLRRVSATADESSERAASA
ncbi:MAG TPA: hemolysin family protein [Ilumatobacter sp.]|nr:hemolysin family protein [Ilumatobacter sp.]